MSIEPPSPLGWIGLVTGVASFFIPGGGPAVSTALGAVGVGVSVVDMVKVETEGDAVYGYWMPHNPIPGEPNSPQWMGPPVYGTPMPPVPLY